MPRYAILTHDFPFPHWDFLLEEGESCRTWRLLSAPNSSDEIIAERLPDHRLLYLTYEGPVSGNRGSVSLWDTGTYESITDGANDFSVKLSGRTLKGIVHVTLGGDGSFRWTLTEGDAVMEPDH
ncbi:MAG: DNA polymerase ligase N-terminal domain-containing protein [Planctomycetota bacterium]